MIADDAAVTIAAANASRVVLDILDGNSPPPEAAWLLLGFKRAWLFDGHGSTMRLHVGHAREPGRREVDDETIRFVAKLIKEGMGDSPASD